MSNPNHSLMCRYESLTRTLAKMVSTRLFVSIDYRKAPETVSIDSLEISMKFISVLPGRPGGL